MLPYFIGPTEEELSVIKQKTNEDDDRFNNSINLLQEWMEKHSNMPKNYDKRILPNYLRACKYDMEKTKRKLEFFYANRALEPQMNRAPDMDSEKIKRMFKTLITVPSKKLTKDGYRVKLIYYTSKNDPDFNPDTIVEYVLALVNLYNVEDGPRMGDIYIFHADTFSVAALSKLMTTDAIKCSRLWQHGVAEIISAIYIVNANEAARRFVNFLKLFLSNKIKERIRFFKNPEELKKHFHADVLPSEYGGNAGSLNECNQEVIKWLRSRREYLLEQEEIKFIGDVPSKYEISNDDMFGTEGSFRKLNLD